MELVQHPPNRRRPDQCRHPERGEIMLDQTLYIVVDGDGSLWHNVRSPSFQTRPIMGRIWSEMSLRPETNTVWRLWQLSIIYLSRIILILTVKQQENPEENPPLHKSATSQRNEYYVFLCHVTSWAFARWRSMSDGNLKTVTRRPEEMPSVPQA